MDQAVGYETLYNVLRELVRTARAESNLELLALDCWGPFRKAVHEAVAEGRHCGEWVDLLDSLDPSKRERNANAEPQGRAGT